MKKLFFYLPALLALTFLNSVDSQWQTYQTPVSENFIAVSVVSESIIWASGNNTSVVRTSNGGVSWEICSGNLPTPLSLWHISALDENTAWVTTGGTVSRIFKTTNGGSTWNEQFYSQPNWIDGLHFFNANTGIFLRDPMNPPSNDTAAFYITRSGGANWYRSPNSPRTTILCDCCFGYTDTNLVWFVDNGKLYKLTGGLDNTWEVYSSGLSNGYTARFVDNNTVYISDGFKLNKSNDGGANFSQVLSDFNSGAISFIHAPNSNMLIASNQGYVRISRDLGISWESTAVIGFGTTYSDARDTSSIWMAANSGRLLKYNHGFIGINPIGTGIPKNFNLHQNYPNPFNPSTKIRFDIPQPGYITLNIYNALGRTVYSLNEHKSAGSYELSFEAQNLSSGIYFYTLTASGFSQTKKMLLLK